MIEHVWPTFWTGAMLHFTSLCVSMEGYSFTATGLISTFRNHLSSSVEPWYCIVASSHMSLLPGQPLLVGSFFFPAPEFSLKHLPQPHTILIQKVQLSVEASLSIYVIVSSPMQLFLSKQRMWCCPSPCTLLLPDCRFNGPAEFMLSQLSSAWFVSLLLPPTLCNLRCGPWQGQT